MASTTESPSPKPGWVLGMGSVFVGVVVWVLLFRRLLPALRTEFTTLHTVAVAALGVAILGTALNDGGITVWYTLTLAFTVTVSALWVDPHLSPQCDSPDCTASRLRRPVQRVVTRAARSFRWEPLTGRSVRSSCLRPPS
jgi:hypothetical protein